MKTPFEMTPAEREEALRALRAQYACRMAEGLKLDLSRGKPSPEQFAFTEPLLTVLASGEDCVDGGTDARNYGMAGGLPSAKAYFADWLGVEPENVFVGGNASLQLMRDILVQAYIWGLPRSERPWRAEPEIKWLCPAPGYDRHFKVTEELGFTLVSVPMTPEGPDMDAVEALVKDPAVKGIWCVPKFSNPDGIVYSHATLERFVRLAPAAPDFTVMWDNAYGIHDFKGYEPFESILALAEEAGTERYFYEFASTSKVTFAGAGISCLAASKENLAAAMKHFSVETIGFDKLNQLRHVRFLKDKAHTLELMEKHASVLAPKFACVQEVLRESLSGWGVSWSDPKGGYFVSFYSVPGTAKRIVELMKNAGIVLTPAGAAFPYGRDPEDRHIRLAPSYPPLEDVRKVMEVFCLCVKMAILEQE